MLKLPIPLQDTSVSEIFSTCANGFRDKEKVKALLTLKKDVVDISNDYSRYVPNNIESLPDYTFSISDNKNLISVYDKKFSEKNFPAGRKYYNKIRAASNGKCAICEIGEASSLDHYLPKAQYPLLCVTPANLVPQCQSCNKNKGIFFEKKEDQMLLHPYFDNL